MGDGQQAGTQNCNVKWQNPRAREQCFYSIVNAEALLWMWWLCLRPKSNAQKWGSESGLNMVLVLSIHMKGIQNLKCKIWTVGASPGTESYEMGGVGLLNPLHYKEEGSQVILLMKLIPRSAPQGMEPIEAFISSSFRVAFGHTCLSQWGFLRLISWRWRENLMLAPDSGDSLLACCLLLLWVAHSCLTNKHVFQKTLFSETLSSLTNQGWLWEWYECESPLQCFHPLHL